MAHTHKHDEDPAALGSGEAIADQAVAYEAEEGEEEKQPKLNLDVKIDDRGACERRISVKISREDIDRYLDKEYKELVPEAHVPGFRPGRAPRDIVQRRFRKEVAGKVKGALLMDSLGQIHDDYDLSAISEPDLDMASVKLPESGPMTFEFDLEVRPQFEVPQWKGLKIEKPVKEFKDADIDRALTRILSNRGRLEPVDAPAQPGDYITTNLTFKLGDQVLSSAQEEVIRLRETLSFRDGKIEGFDVAMTGASAGDTRTVKMQISNDAENVVLRGQEVTGIFEILEVKALRLPELTSDLLEELGGFKLEADLRDAIKDNLVSRLDYQQRQVAREQITKALTVSATWQLPEGLLERQSHRELERAEMELQRSGFSEEEIRRDHENVLRQNSRVSTARALKEHFILERIAEEQEIEADEADYDSEIAMIARQANESPRRIRAKLEKRGSMDVLRNQIIERKVIDLILANAEFKEVPYKEDESDVAALELAAAGQDSDIPAAKAGSNEPIDELKLARGERTSGK